MSSFEATQSEEIQALQAIFFEEFEAISESTPISFNLKLAPSTDDGVVHVSIVLNVCFPTTYPDVKPDFSIISNIGLEEKQLNILRMIIDECASENIGMPMVFTVAERVKEWLLENNKPVTDGSAYAEMLNRQNQGTMKSNVSSSSRYNDPSIARKVVEVIDEEEELRRRRREEEPVTEEIFNEWQSAYIKEIEKMSVYDESLIGTVGRHPPGRLTGRQLFEMDSTLATSDTASSAGEMVVSVSLKDSALDEKTDEDDSDYDSDGGNSGDAAFFEDSD